MIKLLKNNRKELLKYLFISALCKIGDITGFLLKKGSSLDLLTDKMVNSYASMFKNSKNSQMVLSVISKA